jgi:prepilin-type N-terminal cleavage/methylation domain-containing protein
MKPRLQNRPAKAAFTLIELLVVIAIIGVLAAVGIPSLKGMRQQDTMSAATRQLMDDIALARQRAINSRSTVYMIFVPPTVVEAQVGKAFDGRRPTYQQKKAFTNLFGGQFRTYALFSRHNVGDQPGQDTLKYLTKWHTLPDGVFIAPYKFIPEKAVDRFRNYAETNRPFAYTGMEGSMISIPYPTSGNTAFPNLFGGLPYIAFDGQGRLISEKSNAAKFGDKFEDVVIPLARGSIFYPRDREGRFLPALADVKEIPANNSRDNFNRIRVSWLTGRAKVERLELK